jgi:hypothetical protein
MRTDSMALLKGFPMHTRSLLAALLVGASSLLAGCGEAVKRAPVPLDQPLTPATIYLPTCPPNEHTGLFDSRAAQDFEFGHGNCEAMGLVLTRELAPVFDKVRIVQYTPSRDADRFAVKPDKATEAAIGSRYRIVLLPAYASRTRTPGVQQYGKVEKEVSTWVDFAVFSTATGQRIGEASLYSMNGAPSGAQEIGHLIALGVKGPRCQALNKYSMRAFSHAFDGCQSFALYPVDVDQAEDDDAKVEAKVKTPAKLD